MQIAPSMLACDFSKMGEEINKLESSGADLIHMDVMDGHFVPNISFGGCVIKALRGLTDLKFDIHLMISDPIKYVETFSDRAGDIITFHIECQSDIYKTIKKIKSCGKEVGIAVKPKTDISKILHLLPIIDLVLVMTVEPGFGGQSFMHSQLKKVIALRNIIDKNNFKCKIEVDGGINLDTSILAKEAGVDICVAGTSIFKADDMTKIIKTMKG